jgi:hypothetical protein
VDGHSLPVHLVPSAALPQPPERGRFSPRVMAGVTSLNLRRCGVSGSRATPIISGNIRLARNWWAIGLRGAAATLFAITILSLPPEAVAPLVVLFAAYVAADGAFAILAGMRAVGSRDRWPMLMLEGSVNLAAAAAVLVWQAVAVVPLVQIATAWAVITGVCCSQRHTDFLGARVVGSSCCRAWYRPAGVSCWRPSGPATRGQWDCGWSAMQ